MRTGRLGMRGGTRRSSGDRFHGLIDVGGASAGGRPAGGRRLRSFGLRCCSSRKAGSAQTRFAQTRAALIRLSLRCSPQPDSRPQAYRPPTWTRSLCISFRRAQSSRAPKPGRRCGPGDPLCAAEEHSAIGCARSALQHLTRRSCLSAENEVNAASSATQPMARAPQGSRAAAGAPGSAGPHRLPGAVSKENGRVPNN